MDGAFPNPTMSNSAVDESSGAVLTAWYNSYSPGTGYPVNIAAYYGANFTSPSLIIPMAPQLEPFSGPTWTVLARQSIYNQNSKRFTQPFIDVVTGDLYLEARDYSLVGGQILYTQTTSAIIGAGLQAGAVFVKDF